MTAISKAASSSLGELDEQAREISDGLRPVKAFRQISDPQKRAQIIRLAEKFAADPDSTLNAKH